MMDGLLDALKEILQNGQLNKIYCTGCGNKGCVA